MEFLFRAIPDAILFMTGAHIFSNTPMQKNSMIKSIVSMAITIYLIRCLPITFGIHSLLAIVVAILIIIFVLKIELMQAIQATFLTMLIQYVSELINILWIQLCLDRPLESIFDNPITKLFYGLPSLLFSGIILYLYYLIINKGKRAVENGN